MSGKTAKEFWVTIETLFDYLQNQHYLLQEDLAFIVRASAFAESHYAGLTHPVGNSYLSYACGTAKILAGLGAEALVIAAALLYPPSPLVNDVLDELKTQFKDRPDLLRQLDELLQLDLLEWDIWSTVRSSCESRACKERRRVVRKMYLLILNQQSAEGQERVDPAVYFLKREKQLINLIDMFFVAVSDFRPLMIKLAAHLLLMRLLKDVDQTQKDNLGYKQLAKITLDVYAPIADRLGIWRLKSELEDMAFRLLNPVKYKEIGRQLEASKQQREYALTQEIIPTIEWTLREFGLEARISGRAKHIYGIWQKMEAKQLQFEQMNDLLGIRILVDTIEHCYEAQEIIHTFWPARTDFYDGNPGRDWIVNPKQNMYQSLHTTIMMGQKIVEVQIRTYAMHEIAEYGVTSVEYAAHWRYKESKAYKKGKLPRAITSQDRGMLLVKLRKVEEDFHTFPPLEHRDLLPMQKERLKDKIFVITPKGHVIDFPSGATPLDFAYRIHTDLGHNYIGAKVDDHIVRLDYQLENGQIVELIHSHMGRGPKAAWLARDKNEKGESTYIFVRTRQARHKILSGLHKKQR